ncbi:aldehyde dehydrogenase family protein [Streptomyces caeruleatus]|uniref:aldehyde dehydrogenase family protein n=1 Tax=Streptomyces caeruleatus TaxID=661399 RepID=UPI00099EC045|nr:aldehyde dehydrogenase family protein [Streptomyces caeruleatus]
MHGCERLVSGGYFVRPAVVSSVPADHELSTTVSFLPISRVSSCDEALGKANETPMGLTAGIHTGDFEVARVFLNGIEAGCVDVNVPGHATTGWWPGPQTLQGWKASGPTATHPLGKVYWQRFARQQARKLPVEPSVF